ncbi:hypothetical protein AVEN_265797-1 [Araneus ventricosus]|uniref:C2H2-type domain-containing protein n=1 Tax=Araneus ventricosus TaxID=182803 RepID=A0A4Y2RGM8_ARAVE|nr:hypothetical protein AVEN_265797-1 [Araneus ventricosus]
MESTQATLQNSTLPSQVLTIPGWGYITADKLDSSFENDDNQLYSCTLCDETFNLASSLKKQERLRHGNNHHSCFKCKRIFKNIDSLKRCIGLHNDDKMVVQGINDRIVVHHRKQIPVVFNRVILQEKFRDGPTRGTINHRELGLENGVKVVQFETNNGQEKTIIEDAHRESNIVENPRSIDVHQEILLTRTAKI